MAKKPIEVETLTHDATRKNIPTAEFESLMRDQDKRPVQLAYERRNRDLDPQLVWRGKDEQDWSDLIVQAPPLYIQEKVHPKVIIDDLKRESANRAKAAKDAPQFDMFADFNGLPDAEAATEFYQHDQHWSNRMILGDSLQVMASLAEREALKGKVQAIYFDPPYGIKFGSNWQVSTQKTKVADGKQAEVSREPEQVKAFRDTWKDGIHSYLTYLRDRMTVMRELLTESGSIFVQISDENVHRVRAVMDEVFGENNFARLITFVKTSGQTDNLLASVSDYILWYAKDRSKIKYRQPFKVKAVDGDGASSYSKVRYVDGSFDPLSKFESLSDIPAGGSLYTTGDLTSQSPGTKYEVHFQGGKFFPNGYWKTEEASFPRLIKANRVEKVGKTLRYVRTLDDYPVFPMADNWSDTGGGAGADKVYVVQTGTKVVERCLLMATDPGDLVLDPTCGSGTTAYVSEQWGRRWITIDTSRVALALARTRIMAARYPWYLLSDSAEGKLKEAGITGKPPSDAPTFGDVRQGFVYERVPHVMLKTIANNAEIDVIWDKWQERLEPLRAELNQASGNNWQEWEIPREPQAGWSSNVTGVHKAWWEARIARQQEIDASIARAADVEYLYDKPYADPARVRVAGPFTVESLSPHRIVPSDAEELMDVVDAAEGKKKRGPLAASETDFATMVIEHLKTAGVHQTDKADRITFTSLMPWPGTYVGAEGRFMEGETERRAAIFIGPEFGTLSRVDLTAAAREAAECRFDVLIAVSFAFDAHASELTRLGPLPILKAKMNPDLHMAGELKNTGKGNLFTVFGEPDIDILEEKDGRIAVRVNGVDIYDPNTGEVRSNDVKGIAAWFIDTAYNEESFFVRHAYFLGANDPYKQLKTTLKAEIDEEAWATLNRNVSRPFDRPESGRIAVKVINHFGDEVMKVFGV